MSWYDTNTKREIARPDAYGPTTNNITDDQLFGYGVFPVTAVVPAPDGMVADSWKFERNVDTQVEMISWEMPEYVNPDNGETVPASSGVNPVETKIPLNNYSKICDHWYDPVEEAEKAKQARIARFMALTSMVGLASLYRTTLREYFGKDAETNHAITKDSVLAYFIGLQQAQTITAQQLADGNFLDISFTSLTNVWGPDSQGFLSTWELPWELIP